MDNLIFLVGFESFEDVLEKLVPYRKKESFWISNGSSQKRGFGLEPIWTPSSFGDLDMKIPWTKLHVTYAASAMFV